MPIVRAEKLAKCFRIYRHPSDHLKELLSFGKRRHHEAFWAVKDVDVSIDRGICLGIIGENGSGKSTLLRMIAGVVRPTSGKVEVGGRVSALLELGAGFNPQFTGRENIYLYASILGFSDAQTRERIPSIEKFAEIGEFVDRPVKTYSSGMFVRLAFAVGTTIDADVLLIDEALEQLQKEDPEKAKIVVLKFFGGLTNQEVAQSLGVTERTVERQWAFAKAWMFRCIRTEL